MVRGRVQASSMSKVRPRLVLATTCADRKAAVVHERVRLREVRPCEAGRRAQAWARVLQDAPGGRETADRLYLGDHWKSSLRVLEAAHEAGFAAELWVVSAGYGLYPATCPVASYAATFVLHHADSVVPPGIEGEAAHEYMYRWWDALAEHLPLPGRPARTFTQLARQDPRATFLVVSGGAYIHAITLDLLGALQHLRTPDQLAVVSGGAFSGAAGPLDEHMLPVDARFQAVVGGGLSALNARVAGLLMRECGDPARFGLAWAKRYLEEARQELPELPRYERTPMTDDEVQDWVRSRLHAYDRPSASRMLRDLRDGGQACEQKRFGELFKKALRGARGG